MPKKQIGGVRWLPVGSARPHRAQWHTSTRAIVLPSSSRYRTETWRPAPGRPPEETNAERAKRRNQQQAIRGTVSPKTKRQGRRVAGESQMVKQTASHGRDRLHKQHPAAGQKLADKKAKKIVARARHDEVRAIMAAAARQLDQTRRDPEREPSAEERRALDRQRSERERTAARKRDESRPRSGEPAAHTAVSSAPVLPVQRPAEPVPPPRPASSPARRPVRLLPPVQPGPGLMPTFIAPPPRR